MDSNLIEQLMWRDDPKEVQEMMQQYPQQINQALLTALSSEIDHMKSRDNIRAVRRLQQLQQMAADWIEQHPSSSGGLREKSLSSPPQEAVAFVNTPDIF